MRALTKKDLLHVCSFGKGAHYWWNAGDRSRDFTTLCQGRSVRDRELYPE